MGAVSQVWQAGVTEGSNAYGNTVEEITPCDAAIHPQLTVAVFFAHGFTTKRSVFIDRAAWYAKKPLSHKNSPTTLLASPPAQPSHRPAGQRQQNSCPGNLPKR
jgi:hypothetical protein